MKKVCEVCGNKFIAKTSEKTCSPECRKENERIKNNSNAKRFRLRHKEEEEYKRKKKIYESKEAIQFRCEECGELKKIRKIDYIKKSIKICGSCILSGKSKNLRMANKKKHKNNTTGYTGVYLWLNYSTMEPKGYFSKIFHNGINVTIGKYKDNLISDKTKLKCATDRDLYIIKHELPHRRSFTDKELMSNISYIGYEELNNADTLKDLAVARLLKLENLKED